jgi:FtsZ-interacting cell division protein ZipA
MKAQRIGIAVTVLAPSLAAVTLLLAPPASAKAADATDDGAIYEVAGKLGGPAVRVLLAMAAIGLLYALVQRRDSRKANRLADARLRDRLEHRPLKGRPTVAPAYATFAVDEEDKPVRYVPLAGAAAASVAPYRSAAEPLFVAQRSEQYSFVPQPQPVMQPQTYHQQPPMQPQQYQPQPQHAPQPQYAPLPQAQFQSQQQFQPQQLQQFAPRPLAPHQSQPVVPPRLVPQAAGARPDATPPTSWVPDTTQNPEPPRYIAPGSPGW